MAKDVAALPAIEQQTQQSSWRKRSWHRSRIAVIIAAGTLLPAVIMAGSPAMASAATGQVCGTQGTGNSWGVLPNAGNEVDATHFVKQPPGCDDFNLILYETSSGANDSKGLEGLYEVGSTWVAGSRGFVKGIPDATYGDWVLLSDVATGTVMKVWSGGQDFIIVDY